MRRRSVQAAHDMPPNIHLGQICQRSHHSEESITTHLR